MQLILLIVLFSLSLFLPCIGYCQPQAPDDTKAGVVERDLEKKEEELKLEKEIPFIELEIAEEELEIPEGEKIFVKEFTFIGNKLFASRYLKKLVSDYTNKGLSLKQLKEACVIITDEYHKRGYFLAKAYLPVQEIKDGVVLIEIMEGELGEIEIRGNKYYKKKFIKKHLLPLKKRAINYNQLLKSLLILNEYPDLKVRATFTKGKRKGTTDIILDVEDKLPLYVFADYNNSGSRYVSKNRSGARVEYSNLVFGGDRISLKGVTGSPIRNLKFADFDYKLPINSYGTKMGFSYTFSEFDTQREFKEFDMGGKSKIYSFNLNHPLIRNRTTNLDLSAGFDYKQIKNYLLGEVSSDDELRILKFGLNFDHIDAFKGRNYINSLLSIGIPDIMGGLKHDDPKASRLGAGGEFTKFNFGFSRIQRLPLSSYLIFKASAQAASDVLPSPEQISIGGPDSVRGYPVAEHLGDYGYNLSLELRAHPPFVANEKVPFMRKKWKEFIQLVGFVDYGKVFLKSPLAGEHKNNEITGAGIGLRVYFPGDLNISVDWGFPVGGEKPSDGSDSVVYIKASKKF